MEGLGPLRRVVARYSAATRAIYQRVEWRDGLRILQEDAPSLRARPRETSRWQRAVDALALLAQRLHRVVNASRVAKLLRDAEEVRRAKWRDQVCMREQPAVKADSKVGDTACRRRSRRSGQAAINCVGRVARRAHEIDVVLKDDARSVRAYDVLPRASVRPCNTIDACSVTRFGSASLSTRAAVFAAVLQRGVLGYKLRVYAMLHARAEAASRSFIPRAVKASIATAYNKRGQTRQQRRHRWTPLAALARRWRLVAERRRRREETHADEATREDGPAGQASPRRHTISNFVVAPCRAPTIRASGTAPTTTAAVHQLLKRLPFCCDTFTVVLRPRRQALRPRQWRPSRRPRCAT